jgi:hypothetical protein
MAVAESAFPPYFASRSTWPEPISRVMNYLPKITAALTVMDALEIAETQRSM